MVEDFIEERRKVKRPKRLKGNPGDSHVASATGKGNAYQHTNTGYRPDLDTIMRSNWEANWARVLEVFGIKWQYEPMVFTFPIKRGAKAYTPDFYLPATNEWVELKGYLDTKSKTKLKRFKKYYPDEFSRLIMIVSRSGATRSFCETLSVPTIIFYEDLSSAYKDIVGQNWQGR